MQNCSSTQREAKHFGQISRHYRLLGLVIVRRKTLTQLIRVQAAVPWCPVPIFA